MVEGVESAKSHPNGTDFKKRMTSSNPPRFLFRLSRGGGYPVTLAFNCDSPLAGVGYYDMALRVRWRWIPASAGMTEWERPLRNTMVQMNTQADRSARLCVHLR
jgi:hypothetical protein